jgi:hypothetical protein
VQFLPFVVFIVILAIRFARPMRISVTRMWVSPIILCALAAFVVYGNSTLNPAPAWEVAVSLTVGFIAGLPFGVLRGMHTNVRPTEKRGVMMLGSSWITILVFVVAFGLRYVIRILMPAHGGASGAIGDGLLAFAVGFIVASYVTIYRQYEAALSS